MKKSKISPMRKWTCPIDKEGKSKANKGKEDHKHAGSLKYFKLKICLHFENYRKVKKNSDP